MAISARQAGHRANRWAQRRHAIICPHGTKAVLIAQSKHMRQRLLSPRCVSPAVAGGVSAFVVFFSALFCFSVMYSANASIEDGGDYAYYAHDEEEDRSLMMMMNH